ncbi:hypothetical protein [Mycobacterium sp.]|jgi:hypothetical protein|uniref:hypothetical protein n=1 Tax=Mycobacterium sp. TaxID=1785 RepID=UPI002BED91BE|nr:hypothetical protein [Mycobacterium sp.]HTH92636.1 hypothetical protein [Mycobacterium sp.]
MTAIITPRVTPHPLPDADGLILRDGYGPVHEITTVTLDEYTGRVWRNVHRDDDGIHVEFDATLEPLAGASDTGFADPDRLRRIAAVAQATADELAEARARQRHPAGSGLTTA